MEPRLSLVTLGVTDLARARRFYEDGLGWKPSSASTGDVVFFPLGGLVLSLYPRHLLADDARLSDDGPRPFSGITLAHNVRSKAEVDAVLATAREAGARILKPAEDAFWGGYSGYFADPEGHAWEVAWNPHFPLAENGSIELPR